MALLLSSGKRDLSLDPVLTNLAGTLGFSDEALQFVDVRKLGAFITNPISLTPRTPAHPPRTLTFPGGFLLHTGHPNPGLNRVIQQHQRHWRNLPCTLIVHILAQNPADVRNMVERLEETEPVAAIELGLEAIDPEIASELTQAAVTGELPIIAQLPMNANQEIILSVIQSGANAVSLGPPRGTLPGPDSALVSGRLFGPALFPLALKTVSDLRGWVDIPIFASGGIQNSHHVKAFIEMGADAVQLDSVLWTEPERVMSVELTS